MAGDSSPRPKAQLDTEERDWVEADAEFQLTQRGLDTLDALERACAAYARPADDPVEAHHYDLLTHFPDAVGSAHHASNGILFPTCYFDREGEPYLDADGGPR